MSTKFIGKNSSVHERKQSKAKQSKANSNWTQRHKGTKVRRERELQYTTERPIPSDPVREVTLFFLTRIITKYRELLGEITEHTEELKTLENKNSVNRTKIQSYFFRLPSLCALRSLWCIIAICFALALCEPLCLCAFVSNCYSLSASAPLRQIAICFALARFTCS